MSIAPKMIIESPINIFPLAAGPHPRRLSPLARSHAAVVRNDFPLKRRPTDHVSGACGYTEPRMWESAARCQRQFALGVGPQRQCKKVAQAF
jgi:hypothetical protein